MLLRSAMVVVVATTLACSANRGGDLLASICDGCNYSCEPVFTQAAPFVVRVQDCVLETPAYVVESREYEFSADSTILIARSLSISPKRVEIRARRNSHEEDALSAEELASDLLREAVDFLQSRGKSEIKILTPHSFYEEWDFYDSLPPTPRPAV